MSYQIVVTDIVNEDVGAALGTTDSIFVGAGATVGSTSTAGITGSGSNHVIDVWGTVVAQGFGIDLGFSDLTATSGQQITIHAGGLVNSLNAAIRFRSHDSTLLNDGEIQGDGWGIIAGGTAENGVSTITNHGVIRANDRAIARFVGATEKLVIVNDGVITGGGASFNGGSTDAVDQITNNGSMTGNILLSLGNDRYDGRGGKIKGVVYGEGGSDTLLGGKGSDSLDGGDNKDSLNGGAGADRLTGGNSKDNLTGGSGADVFDFNLRSDSTVSSTGRDTISDFSHSQHDQIDLVTIDAKTITGGNNSFKFIGTAAYGHHEGELHYKFSGNTTVIAGDVNGDGTSDFAITLQGKIALVAGDFLL